MLSWAVTFLVIGLIAGVLGVSGVAGTATHIAYVLFVVFLILAAIGMVMGKRPPVACRRTGPSSAGANGVDDRFIQLAGGAFFGHEDRRTGAEHRFLDVAFVLDGQPDDHDVRMGGEDLACRLNAVDFRHIDVHHHHVRFEGRRERDRGLSIAGFSDHVEIFIAVQYTAQSLPYHRVVIDEQHA